MNAREWLDGFAAELGTEPPSNDEIKAILDLAAVAAHASERIAAPVACWVGGRAGASLAELQAAAERVGALPGDSEETGAGEREAPPGESGGEAERLSGDSGERERLPGDSGERERLPGDSGERERLPGDSTDGG